MRETWTFHSAGQLVFGRNAVKQLGEIARRLGGERLLIVTDPHVARAGLVDRVRAPIEEADVRVHAELGARDRLHVLRPVKPGRVDHPLDSRGSRASDVEPHVPEVAMRRAADGRQERVGLFLCCLRAFRRLTCRSLLLRHGRGC